jgi:hypothetical protein
VLAAAIAVAGCGGSDDEPVAKTTPKPPPARTTPKPPPAPRGNTVYESESPVAVRYLRRSDWPGFSGAPNARVQTDVRKFVGKGRDAKESIAELRRLGFVAGVRGALVDERRTRGVGIVVVLEFKEHSGATGQLDASYAAARRESGPASGRFTPFDVPGIPTARGWDFVSRGTAAHNLAFVDGRFFYVLGVTAYRQAPKRGDVVSAALGWYTRVHNHPNI